MTACASATPSPGGGSETFYLYDPQGTVASRVVSSDPAVQYDGEPFTDISVWDGYGQERSDQWTVGPGAVDRQYTADDPVGFEGQAGYYADWELAKSSNPAQYVYLTTTPSLLTRRYYDASTGRFVSRDPIGYNGGQNLYAYCGGNPVNETDPSGMDTHVVETDSDIVVDTRLQFQGPKANAANAARVVQDISKAWNRGFTYDGKPVHFQIHYTVGGNAIDHYDQVYLQPGVLKYDKATSQWINRSNVNALPLPSMPGVSPPVVDQSKFDFWPQQTKVEHLYMGDPDFSWVAAHEFSHILGYMDEYNDDKNGNSVAIPGFKNSILAARDKPVDNHIIQLWGDYFRGHHGTWLKF